MKRRSLSIANELDEIVDALAAARLLANDLRNDQLGTEAEMLHAPTMIAAVVNIAIARMQLVARVLRGTINPRLIWTEANDAEGVDPDSQEMVMVEWDLDRRIDQAKSELRRLKLQRSRRK